MVAHPRRDAVPNLLDDVGVGCVAGDARDSLDAGTRHVRVHRLAQRALRLEVMLHEPRRHACRPGNVADRGGRDPVQRESAEGCVPNPGSGCQVVIQGRHIRIVSLALGTGYDTIVSLPARRLLRLW